MRSAKVFLAWCYLHLLLSFLVPVVLLLRRAWTGLTAGLFFLYLLQAAGLWVMGWAMAVCSARVRGRGEEALLRKSRVLVKLGGLPFQIVNAAYTVFAWLMLIGASRGIMLILVPIPVLYTYGLIVQGGAVGGNWVRCLRRQREDAPGRIHYLMQMLPVLDILSTAVLLWSEKGRNVREEEPWR